MMGPNMMMAMMAIRVDHDTIKAGSMKFGVTNRSRVTRTKCSLSP
jgi:hypothetical protein